MPRFRYVRCDVFTAVPFGGNPLAVFTDARGLAPATMQSIALEMNLSETVFVLPAAAGGLARIRIFTPRAEVEFAGHPTIGAAFVLSRPLQTDRLLLETAAGNIPVRVDREGADPRAAWLELPLPDLLPFDDGPQLLRALGLSDAITPIARYRFGITHAVVQLGNAEAVAAMTPNMGELSKLGPLCFTVFAQNDSEVKARMFAPAFGVNEDPATGSAVAPIALHIQRHGTVPQNRALRISQGVELGRPSELKAEYDFAGEQLQRIYVGGECVLLGRGEWQIPGRSPD